jgi:D-alanyl-D-alanine carboxypeptidase (penicillin-binding protein 5/6)
VPAAFAAVAAGLLAALIAVAHAAPSATATKKDEPFHANVPAALLLDPDSESILYEKNGEELVAPASLAKLMTLEYVFNEIKQGRLKLDEEVIISENAWRKGGAPSRGSTMYAAIHSRVKVDDLIHGIIVDSANDACIALAEALAGNENAFGAMLTKRARELGLEKSTFTNSTGYSDPKLRVTARELAALSRHIMQTYPEFYPYFAERELPGNIRQQNRNPLLAMGIGADRLKTGETSEAGFNLVGSAVEEGFRLIVVVTGAKSEKERAEEARKLLDWGFHGFESKLLFAEGQTVGEARVWRQHELRSARRARHRAGRRATATSLRPHLHGSGALVPRASPSASSRSGGARTSPSKYRSRPPRMWAPAACANAPWMRRPS